MPNRFTTKRTKKSLLKQKHHIKNRFPSANDLLEINYRLSRIRITNRTLDLDSSQAGKPQTPRQFLTRVVLKTPVPLWMPSCVARGISHVILSQCNEYFELRCHLLRGLSLFEQEVLGVSAPQMMEDEFNFLNNFTSCGRLADNTLIAGQ